MFWLFNNNDNKIYFLQIFPHYKKYKDTGAGTTNFVYDFTESNLDIGEFKINLKNIKPIRAVYTIKIKDSYVQYSNNTNTLTFHIDNEFIKENDDLNKLKIPYFKWKYTKTDNHKLPNLSFYNYDFHYENATFDIYKITDDKLFIVESINNITKKYILEKYTLEKHTLDE